MDNSRILVIGDLHFPYHRKETFEFLQRLKTRYNPTRVISIGDESDGASWKFHPINTLAMEYSKNNLKHFCLGSLMILDGWPIPIPMVLDSKRSFV